VTASAASRPIAIAPAPSAQRETADQLEIHWSIASVEEASVMRPSSRARGRPLPSGARPAVIPGCRRRPAAKNRRGAERPRSRGLEVEIRYCTV
jgi:hypothetical protein